MEAKHRFENLGQHQGGMAVVDVYRDRTNGRLVAAKSPTQSPARFDREARIWIGLGKHPNIVQAHVVLPVDGQPTLFMEFVGDPDGNPRTLRRLLAERGRLPVSEVLRLGAEVTLALQHAQSLFPGFVHRDLKPENILVKSDGTFCVSDFGISQLHAETDPPGSSERRERPAIASGDTVATESGAFLGTFGYAAPEQRAGMATPASDLYALGIVLEEALCGSRASEDALTARASGSPAAANGEAQPPDEPGAAQLMELTARLRSPDPACRPVSLETAREALEMIGDSIGITTDSAARQSLPDDDDFAWGNRIRSLVALGRNDLAIPAVEHLHQRSPWFSELPSLGRAAGVPLRRMVTLDLAHPSRVLGLLGFWAAMIAAVLWRLGPQEGPRLALLVTLMLGEAYVNHRTGKTLNAITYPGFLIGLVTTAYAQGLGDATTGGGWLAHLVVAAGGLALSPLVLGRLRLGSGTFKLLLVIAAFVGPWALAVLAGAAVVLVSQSLWLRAFLKNGGVVWRGDRLCSSAFSSTTELSVPTSPALLIATLFTLLIVIPGAR